MMEDEDAESYKDSQVTADADKEQEETTEETEETTEAPPEEKEEQEEKKGNNVTGIMAVVLIITLAGMGGFGYMKSNKGKRRIRDRTRISITSMMTKRIIWLIWILEKKPLQTRRQMRMLLWKMIF